jgi:lipid-A-disaccharide synthase
MLRLGPELKRLGVKVFYYIAPQVWAWHAERAAQMAAWVDRLAVVFPFEERIFRDAGVAAHFVGHPLLDDLAPNSTKRPSAPSSVCPPRPVWSGSCPGVARARCVRMRAPSSRSVSDCALGSPTSCRCSRWRVTSPTDGLPATLLEGVKVVEGENAQRAGACRLLRRRVGNRGRSRPRCSARRSPSCIAWGGSIMRSPAASVKLSHIGLPNIVAGREVAPEFIQGDFRADTVAATLGGWLADPMALAERREALREVRARLGGGGASERTARLLAEVLA